MIRRALEFMPALARLERDPDVDRVSPGDAGQPALIVGRRGAGPLRRRRATRASAITTALGTARLVADAILGRASAIDPAPYRADARVPGGGACLSRRADDRRPRASAPTRDHGGRRARERRRARAAGRPSPASRAASSARWASASSAASRSTASRTGAPAWRSCATGCASRRRASLQFPVPAAARGTEALACDVAVVGARAGRRRGGRAARPRAGARTVVLDEAPAPGGQIYRHLAGAGLPTPRARLARAARALGRGRALRRGGLRRRRRATAAGSSRPRRRRALCVVRARRLVLATGARELFLPFPGWTLPGVMGAGGAQAMVEDRSGASRAHGRRGRLGRRCCFPWPRRWRRGGAEVALVAEQAARTARSRSPRRSGAPGKLVEGRGYGARLFDAPYRTGAWVREAAGARRARARR